MRKISICTISMNRLYHLRETLPANIMHNMDYPGVEFVLLDYNSKDGMEDWVRSEMGGYIQSGKLKYYKTYEPEYFRMSHSKNMSLRLSSGDIVCLVDADNYTGLNYAGWVDSIFSKKGDNTILTTLRKDSIPYRDQAGRFCSYKTLFQSVNGFDESLIGYGMDDVDLVNRLEKAGGNREFIHDAKYLKCIGHSDFERLKNFQLINSLESLYLQITDNMLAKSRILYLLKDNTFLDVNYEYVDALKKDPIQSHQGWTIKEDEHKKGSYNRITSGLLLTFDDDQPPIHCREENDGILKALDEGKKIVWKKISNKDKLYNAMVMAYGLCSNHLKYTANDRNHKSVNPDGWGKGTVYLNFDKKTPIQL